MAERLEDEQLECPRCRLPAARGGRAGHCSHCGMRLVPAAGPKESAVRAYLYGRRLPPLARPAERRQRVPG